MLKLKMTLCLLLLTTSARAQEADQRKWYYFGLMQNRQTTIGVTSGSTGTNADFKPRPRLGRIDYIFDAGQKITQTRLGSQRDNKFTKRFWTTIDGDRSSTDPTLPTAPIGSLNLQNLRPDSYLLSTGASVRADAYIVHKPFIARLPPATAGSTKISVVFVDTTITAGASNQGNALIGLLIPDYASAVGKDNPGNLVKAALVIPKTGQIRSNGHILYNNDDSPGGVKLAALPSTTTPTSDLFAVTMEIGRSAGSPEKHQDITFKTFTLAKGSIEDPGSWTSLSELTLTANGDEEGEYTLFFSAEPKTYGIVAIRIN